MTGAAPPLVIGLGNVLLRDEGIGVRVVEEIQRRVADGLLDLPSGTVLVDGGTLGLDLLHLIAASSTLILVDAVGLGPGPGSVTVIRGDAIEGALPGHVFSRPVGVADLVGAARLVGVLPARVSLVGIRPAAIDAGLALTPSVEAAVPKAIEAICAELGRHDGTGGDAAAAPARE